MEHRTDGELGASLKKLRLAAGMTQEELAERAGISARTVSDVERGLRTLVHRDTARRLGAALELGDEQRREFDAVARGRRVTPLPAPSTGALPTVPTPLIGRSGELEAVATVLQDPDVRLLTLTGAGGIEASARPASPWRLRGASRDPSRVESSSSHSGS